MSERTTFACEMRCPLGSGVQLAELAVQEIPMEAWLYDADSPFDPPYSEAAVRTASAHFNVSCPTENPMYGSPREIMNRDMYFLGGLSQQIERRDHVEKEEIAELCNIVVRRDAVAERFTRLRVEERAQRFANARPFLDRVAVDALDQAFPDPYAIEPGVMQGPSSANQRPSRLRELYSLDQRAFVVARRALEVCDGPMLLEHRTLRHPFRGEAMGVCPNGSKDIDYFRAYQALLDAPRGIDE